VIQLQSAKLSWLKRVGYTLVVVGVVGLGIVFWPKTGALSPWSPGRIIDDNVFYDTNTFSSVQDIQNFINSHTPACDTWGTGPSEYGGGTRAQYAAKRGWHGPPYACLRDYHENPSTKETSFERGGGWFTGGLSVANIIWNVSKEFGINPQVMLVTLKKEQGSLFTDVWPLKSQYKYAMGFACPDSGPGNTANCSNEYAGMYNQLRMAARQFRLYTNRPGEYRYKAGRSNYIQYSPNAACGGSWVYIENQATANLYNYTPYQPNQGALNAYPGTAHCGAYGNRNFWRFFNEWFGSPLNSVRIESPLSVRTEGTGQKLFTDMTITASFTIRNATNQRRDLGTMAIAARDSKWNNYDFGSQRVVLEPWQKYTYRATIKLTKEEDYKFWITNYRDGAGWSDNYPESASGHSREVSAFVQTAPTVTSAITIQNPRTHKNQPTRVGFQVKNNSGKPIDLGYFGLAMTSPSGRNADVVFDTVNQLSPGATYDYNKEFIPREEGVYRARISGTLDQGKTWTEAQYPIPTAASANNRTTFTILSNPTLTQGLTLSNANPRAGEPVTATFKLKNFSNQPVTTTEHNCFILRSQSGANHDFGCLSPATIQPNQELEFKATRSFPVGTYSAYFSTFDGRHWRDYKAPPLETGQEAVKAEMRVLPDVVLSEGMSISGTTARSGDRLTGTFKLKNLSSVVSNSNKQLCYIIRAQDGGNYDLGCLSANGIQPGGQSSFSLSRIFDRPGKYEAFFALYDNGAWYEGSSLTGLKGNESTRTTFTILSNPTLTQGLTLSNANPRAGEPVTATFKLKNFSNQPVTTTEHNCFILRSQSGANHDFGCLSPATIQPNQELEFKATRSFPVGTYSAYFSTFDGRHWRDYKAPPLETGQEAVKAEMRVSN
jgi:hypothetical protein